jgi:hypothetical protein
MERLIHRWHRLPACVFKPDNREYGFWLIHQWHRLSARVFFEGRKRFFQPTHAATVE